MTIETFQKAKGVRETIDHIRVKRLQIEHMKARDNDADFTLARELANDALSYAINSLENEFKQL